jgi:hypothetical protein
MGCTISPIARSRGPECQTVDVARIVTARRNRRTNRGRRVLITNYGLAEARIRRAAPDVTLWQATVYPSSTQGEWGIRAIRMGDVYELTVVRLDRSLWGTGWAKTKRNEFKRDLSSSPARPRATTHKISARLFTELESAIRRSIEAARVPHETSLADALNLHGVLFRFEVAGSGCGETLAAIVLALCNPSDENRIFHMLYELQD